MILGSYILGVGALGVGVVSLSRQASVATERANAAISQIAASRRDAAAASCDFILAFVTKPGEPPYTTARGRLQETKARAAYVKNGCAAITGPIPPAPAPSPTR